MLDLGSKEVGSQRHESLISGLVEGFVIEKVVVVGSMQFEI